MAVLPRDGTFLAFRSLSAGSWPRTEPEARKTSFFLHAVANPLLQGCLLERMLGVGSLEPVEAGAFCAQADALDPMESHGFNSHPVLDRAVFAVLIVSAEAHSVALRWVVIGHF